MTDTDWADWSSYHATLHRFCDADDLAMLDLWRESFEARGFTSDDLKSASRKLAEDPKGHEWRTKHLEFLLQHVSHAMQARQQAVQRYDRPVKIGCQDCRDTGLVAVPQPGFVRDGVWVWPWYDGTVACLCPRGVHRFNFNRNYLQEARSSRKMIQFVRPLIDLMAYELLVPNWREIVAYRVAQRERERETKERAAFQDRKRGPLQIGGAVKQVLQKVAVPVEQPEAEEECPF